MPLLRSKRADIRNDPDVMVIHLGGNSIGTYGNTRISLMRRMKADIREIDLLFPKTKLMFSDILPRWNWRGQTATTGYGLERTRRWLNGAMFGFLSDMGDICSGPVPPLPPHPAPLQMLCSLRVLPEPSAAAPFDV
ncbi:hypothetical protein SKAU_G00281390 [Synaphobranchus kaupii]|uniref:Uncharacterized protein n=1 Tax=Synaphobranchus kaupii TaxID=118154 RepID=A0A9Q1EXA5_SYNKA|nr:hypothetical protein SKAU_G00281390 [Synaphobranchus kaupii]